MDSITIKSLKGRYDGHYMQLCSARFYRADLEKILDAFNLQSKGFSVKYNSERTGKAYFTPTRMVRNNSTYLFNDNGKHLAYVANGFLMLVKQQKTNDGVVNSVCIYKDWSK